MAMSLYDFDSDERTPGFSWDSLDPATPHASGGFSFDAPTGPAPSPGAPKTPSDPMSPMSPMTPASWKSPTTGPSATPQTQSFAAPGYQPSAPMAQPGAAATPSAGVDFSSAVQQLKSITDPTQLAMARDKLSRDLFTSLKDRHDVKWQGDQLMIDGRLYDVAGAGGGTGIVSTDPSQRPPIDVGGGGTDYESLVMGLLQDQGYGPQGLENIAPTLEAHGIQVQRDSNGRVRGRIKLPNGDIVDLPGAGEGNDWWTDPQAGGFTWTDRGQAGLDAGGWSFGGANSMAGPGFSFDTLGGGAAEVDLATTPPPPAPASATGGPPGMVPGIHGGWVPPDHPLAQPGAAPGAAPAPWAPGQGPTYEPGDISFDDIPAFDYDQMINELMGEDSTDVATRQLIERILRNPESLDDRTVDMMKAKSREEIAEMSELDDAEMRLQGEASGVGDSPWLRAERNAGKRDRDRSLVESNRTIDLEAAATRGGDRRAAAQLGAAFTGQKAQQRQAAAALASNNLFQQAALRGDRMALRESVQQEAARLGQSADQVMSNWLISQMDDATRRYGIDIARDVDMAKLSQASQEWKEELMFRFAQLAQADRQFGAGYGLDLARHEFDLDNEMWRRYLGSD